MKMNKRRLLKLADLLEADARKKVGIKFDLSFWGSMEMPSKPLSCNTTACAMGLAAISGAFEKEGLSYSLSPSGDIHIQFKDEIGGFRSAELLFGITRECSKWLFDFPFYNTAKLTGRSAELMVARRIRNYVDGSETPPSPLQIEETE